MFHYALSVLIASIALQISGLGTIAEHLGASTEANAGCCSDCPMEQDGRECPPGCPNCHCSHGGVGLPAAVDEADRNIAAQARIEAHPYEATVPRAPPAPGIYRPPRTSSSLT
jgi:hypothetical protein